MNNFWYALWVVVFLYWFGFFMGDMEPRKHNKSVLKVIGGALLLGGCVLLGIYLGGRYVQT